MPGATIVEPHMGRMLGDDDCEKVPTAKMNNGNKQSMPILENPPRRPAYGRCLRCRRWFAMKLVLKESHAAYAMIRTFRCKHCGHEQKFVDQLPRDVT